ncbi:LPS assembly protein LptD [Pantoea sp. 1.19]|uniref:LPS assembly protein LptD n=1 Tax=Pantoea sp. 1.19 TaxID=1925589 RepID=UPI000A416F37
MKKRLPTLLATLIGSALYSQSGLADDLQSQCMLGVPSFNRPPVNGNADQLPVTINADQATGNYPDDAVFTGKVDVKQGNSRLQADEVQVHQRQPNGQDAPVRTVDALGNVHYDDDQVILKGPKAWSNLNTKDTNVWNGNYQMVGRQGRGVADQMKLRGDNRYTILENGSFTSCLPGDNSWSVVGSEVIHDRDEQVAEIWNARFKLGAVPIFYSPYLQLPVGDRRRSGFLIPNAKYGSNSGFEFTLPYYWNIAPQADATITPHYISRRGLQWQNEFRYLTRAGAGLMELDYLPSDKIYEDERAKNGEDSKRWLFYWQHAGVYDQHWRFNVDYLKVSDPYYFTDLTSNYGSTTDGYAAQKFSIGYADTNWNATLSTKQFQVFPEQASNNVYRAEPQLDINAYQNDIGPFDGHIYAQAVKFTNVNDRLPDATRLHAEPTLSLPLSNGWASLNTEAKLLATHYEQDDLDYYNTTYNPSSPLASSVNRVMPQYKVDGKLVFDRDMNWAEGYTQTLEPRVQYLYTPYRDQSQIGLYDTTLLQTDYTGLFRDRAYSGLDRIASTNQVATGVTTRIFDNDLVERFNVSVGQIYQFTPSRVAPRSSDRLAEDDTGSLIWAGDTYWKVSDRWGIRGGMQYDTRLDNIAQGNAVLEYRRDADRMLQLNYRYSSPEYVSTALNRDITKNPIYENGISQVGATASWPIADAWSVVGAYYYDTKSRQPADQLVGVQYSSCCYAIRVGYERKITSWDNENLNSKYDNQVTFNIELRGLSPNYGLGTGEMLRSGILPYQRAF